MKFPISLGRAIILSAGSIALAMPASAAPALENTGSDVTGTQDNAYFLLDAHNGTQTANAQVFGAPFNVYATPPSGSQYITSTDPAGAEAPAGTYFFQTSFTSAGGGTLTGDFSADNSGTVYLNNVLIGTVGGFGSLQPFNSSDFGQFTVAGTNFLEFDVVNDPDGNPTNPMALLATNLTETSNSVPEIDPGSAATPAALCIALLLIAADRRRKATV